MTAGPFADFVAEEFCYLTTTGRTSGMPRTIEIWFGTQGECLFLLTREHVHWLRNLVKQPLATVRIGNREFRVTGRIVDDPSEDALARRLLLAKYEGDLTDWGRTSVAVALDAR